MSIPMIRLLTALAVHNGRTLKQADCKFAFIQATLPKDQLTIVHPPIGCPFSKGSHFWWLKKVVALRAIVTIYIAVCWSLLSLV
jgi:hypothetical protein